MNTPQRHEHQDTRRSRAVAVAAATVAPVTVWLIASFALGIEISSPAFGPDQPSAPIGPGRVAMTALAVSGAAWALLAVLERVTDRARTVWSAIAGTVLLVSLGGPIGGQDIATSTRLTLLAMHLAVGLTLIPWFYGAVARAAHEPAEPGADAAHEPAHA